MERLHPWLRRCLLSAVYGFFGVLTLTAALIALATHELTGRGTCKITPYHQQWIGKPENHGMRIETVSLLDGAMPCLVVEPSGSLSQRGSVIRRQLLAMGITPPPFGTIDAQLVLLHGRNGCKEQMLPIAERFCAVGFRCLIPDLPGPAAVGRRTEQPEVSLRPTSALSMMIAEWNMRVETPALPSAIWGISMGGAYATRFASQDPSPWKALVLVSTFDRLDGVIEDQLRTRMGRAGTLLSSTVLWNVKQTKGIALDSIHPADWAREVSVPVLVAHGTDDRLVNLERGRVLFESFPSPRKEWVLVPGGTHDTVLATPMPLYATMAHWLLTNLTESEPSPPSLPNAPDPSRTAE